MPGGNPYVIYRADGQTFITQPVQIVGPDGVPLGTVENPINVAGGTGGGGSAVTDVTDRAARLLGHTSVDNWPTAQDISDRIARLLGHVAVDNFPSTQPVSGTFWPPTQLVSGPLTDAQLRASPVPINGAITNFPATQSVSGPLTDTQLRASVVPVQDKTSNTLGVTATAAVGVAVTATLPAAGAGQYQCIEFIEITAYSTAARTGTATPVVVTSTNLPTSHAWTFPTAAAIGTTVTYIVQPTHPMRAAAANTATTIVCPATPSVIWRVNMAYWTSS